MSSLMLLQVNTSDNANDQITRLRNMALAEPWGFVREVCSYFRQIECGVKWANITLRDSGAQSTQTVTWSGAGSNGDTVVVGGITFTAVAASPTAVQYTTGGSATATATNFAAAINQANGANAMANVVTAVAVAGVVTLTSTIPGTVGNLITLSKTGAQTAVGGTALASGAETVTVVSAGL